MDGLDKQIPVKVLGLILKELSRGYDEGGHEADISADPYEDSGNYDFIYGVIKKFGIVKPKWEDFGFFWRMLQLNHPYSGGTEIIIPKANRYQVTTWEKQKITRTELRRHEIVSYYRDYVANQVTNGDDFYHEEGELIQTETNDYEILNDGIKDIELVSENIEKGEPINESEELKKLIQKRDAINARIAILTS